MNPLIKGEITSPLNHKEFSINDYFNMDSNNIKKIDLKKYSPKSFSKVHCPQYNSLTSQESETQLFNFSFENLKNKLQVEKEKEKKKIANEKVVNRTPDFCRYRSFTSANSPISNDIKCIKKAILHERPITPTNLKQFHGKSKSRQLISERDRTRSISSVNSMTSNISDKENIKSNRIVTKLYPKTPTIKKINTLVKDGILKDKLMLILCSF